MFKIGDFSKFSHVSVRALRLYDQMGLLKPLHVDQSTGYRYYSVAQLPTLNRIVAFKELGFSLEQISQLLQDHVSLTEMRGMLRLKQSEIKELIVTEEARLRLIEFRLQQIEQAESSAQVSYDVILKPAEAQTVASIRDVLPRCSHVKYLYDEIAEELSQLNVEVVGTPVILWHDPDYRVTDVDAEVTVPIRKRPSSGVGRVKYYQLPKVELLACVYHRGTYDSVAQAFNTLLAWIESNHYQIVGVNREIYWQPGIDQGGFVEAGNEFIVEVQFPVHSLKS
jgi:effector-binding domain-containing protein